MRLNSLERLHTGICTSLCTQLAVAEVESSMSCDEACLLCSSCLKNARACVWTACLACYHPLDHLHYFGRELPKFSTLVSPSYQLRTTLHRTATPASARSRGASVRHDRLMSDTTYSQLPWLVIKWQFSISKQNWATELKHLIWEHKFKFKRCMHKSIKFFDFQILEHWEIIP